MDFTSQARPWPASSQSLEGGRPIGRINRCELIDEAEVGIYHCINRCVRRALLCGKDPNSDRSFDHRKEWLQKRMEHLAGNFALDVLAFAIMSNHFHVILRNRPDIVRLWTDEEVVRRWWQLFPKKRDDDGNAAELTEIEMQALCSNETFVAERRRRLSSISWFMRCLCEPIARRANREDEVTGRFWQGRFRCHPLLDESHVLACTVYVELNPIKAGAAEAPATAQFTSIYERLKTSSPPESESASNSGSGQSQDSPASLESSRTREVSQADWLSPVELATPAQSTETSSRQRASDRGFLPMSLPRYIELVTWTALQLRAKPCTSALHEIATQLLARIEVDARTFVQWVESFGRLTRRAAGRDPSLAKEAARCGRQWLQRSCESRRLLG